MLLIVEKAIVMTQLVELQEEQRHLQQLADRKKKKPRATRALDGGTDRELSNGSSGFEVVST